MTYIYSVSMVIENIRLRWTKMNDSYFLLLLHLKNSLETDCIKCTAQWDKVRVTNEYGRNLKKIKILFFVYSYIAMS